MRNLPAYPERCERAAIVVLTVAFSVALITLIALMAAHNATRAVQMWSLAVVGGSAAAMLAAISTYVAYYIVYLRGRLKAPGLYLDDLPELVARVRVHQYEEADDLHIPFLQVWTTWLSRETPSRLASKFYGEAAAWSGLDDAWSPEIAAILNDVGAMVEGWARYPRLPVLSPPYPATRLARWRFALHRLILAEDLRHLEHLSRIWLQQPVASSRTRTSYPV